MPAYRLKRIVRCFFIVLFVIDILCISYGTFLGMRPDKILVMMINAMTVVGSWAAFELATS